MQGILLVDKPAGWTSFDVVNYVRKIARQAALAESLKVKSSKSVATSDFRTLRPSTPLPKVKVGHSGTLDPFATGLLILLIGKDYTRRASEFNKMDKTYEVTMRLGEASTTGDPEGEITVVSDRQPMLEAIEAALQQFIGEIEQVPPAYSAIKVNGQRAYKLARAGKEVIIEPRPVTIHSLKLDTYTYPEVKFTAHVSSGTYIRTLVEDLGRTLNTGAYTAGLKRTAIADYSLQSALTVSGLDAAKMERHLIAL